MDMGRTRLQCRYEIIGDDGQWIVVSWEDLARDNDADTMEEIADLPVGGALGMGMSDFIRRVL